MASRPGPSVAPVLHHHLRRSFDLVTQRASPPANPPSLRTQTLLIATQPLSSHPMSYERQHEWTDILRGPCRCIGAPSSRLDRVSAKRGAAQPVWTFLLRDPAVALLFGLGDECVRCTLRIRVCYNLTLHMAFTATWFQSGATDSFSSDYFLVQNENQESSCCRQERYDIADPGTPWYTKLQILGCVLPRCAEVVSC